MRLPIFILLTVFTMTTSVYGWVTFTSNEENHKFNNNETRLDFHENHETPVNNQKFIGKNEKARQSAYDQLNKSAVAEKKPRIRSFFECCLPNLQCTPCRDILDVERVERSS